MRYLFVSFAPVNLHSTHPTRVVDEPEELAPGTVPLYDADGAVYAYVADERGDSSLTQGRRNSASSRVFGG